MNFLCYIHMLDMLQTCVFFYEHKRDDATKLGICCKFHCVGLQKLVSDDANML
jgi:hypothetical protein